MASVRKYPGSANWVACYTLPDGKRLQRTTKTRDKSKALQIALAAERLAREGGTEDAAKAILFDIVERMHGQRVSDETFAAYSPRWIARKSGEIGKATTERYQVIIDDISEYLGALATAPMSSMQPALLSRWRDGLAQRLSPKTVNAYVSCVKQCLSDAVTDGVLAKSPASHLSRMRVAKHSPRRAFTLEELTAILREADGEWENMILLGLYSAQRLGDIATMETREIDESGWWRRGTRKTGYSIAVPLPDFLASRLRASRGKYVFPDAAGIFAQAGDRSVKLSLQFHAIMVRAGLAEKRSHKGDRTRPHGRNGRRQVSEISFHSLRHTTTSLLKMAGVSESVAMGFVGHDSKAMNRQYTHLPESSLREAADKLPDITKIISIRAA